MTTRMSIVLTLMAIVMAMVVLVVVERINIDESVVNDGHFIFSSKDVKEKPLSGLIT